MLSGQTRRGRDMTGGQRRYNNKDNNKNVIKILSVSETVSESHQL